MHTKRAGYAAGAQYLLAISNAICGKDHGGPAQCLCVTIFPDRFCNAQAGAACWHPHPCLALPSPAPSTLFPVFHRGQTLQPASRKKSPMALCATAVPPEPALAATLCVSFLTCPAGGNKLTSVGGCLQKRRRHGPVGPVTPLSSHLCVYTFLRPSPREQHPYNFLPPHLPSPSRALAPRPCLGCLLPGVYFRSF